ncbi:hypothetical protein C8F01DRAFT_1248230 [Mycena amicta]|nr:hypothetical protein C8F01DRAFT_1248230 [Mycena amicta]
MTTSPQLVSREIVNEYHRFRILVVGKAGVGKSSLIHHAFGVTTTISAESRGVCKIDDELVSEQKHLFVLHDSMGFEPGQEENLKEAKQFLERRSGDVRVPIHDRVHAIWLCIQTPPRCNEQNSFNCGFTQFDKLFNKYLLEPNAAPNLNGSLSDSKFHARCLKFAEAEFEKNCAKPLKKMSAKVPTRPSKSDMAAVANLINITRDLLEKEGSLVWVMSAMAQHGSADTKIKASIEIGMRRYWSGLAAGAKFMGMKLDTCIGILHSEIIATWNFLDEDNLLESPSAAIAAAAAGPIAPIVVPTIAGVGLSALFAAYLTAYHSVPETLPCLMAYIVDLTLIMEELFHIALAFRPIRTLAMEDIELALDNYVKSHAAKKAEDEVRSLFAKNRRSEDEGR